MSKMALRKADLDMEGFANSRKHCYAAGSKPSSSVFIALPLSSCVLPGWGYPERGSCRLPFLLTPSPATAA